MVNGRDRVPSRDELQQRADAREPIVNTPAIDMLAEADLPFRGEMRQNIIQRVRAQIRSRRTVEGVATRIANNATSPITNAVQDEAQDRVKGRVEERIQQRIQESGDNR